jgi:hypothetical protein
MQHVICESAENMNWRSLYRAAVREPDASQIPVRIASAQNAIVLRARELFQDTGSNLAEQQALDAALGYLQVLHRTLRQSSAGQPDGRGEPLKAA